MAPPPRTSTPSHTTSGSATGESSVERQPNPQTVTETAKPELSVLPSELVKPERKSLIPAKKEEPVILTECVETLHDTVAYHFELIHKIKEKVKVMSTPPPNPLTTVEQDIFYESFQKQFTGKDLTDPKVLEVCAGEFLQTQEGRGAVVRLVEKQAEWEQATIQAAIGREFIKGTTIMEPKPEIETVYVLTKDGLKKVIRPKEVRLGSLWQRIFGGGPQAPEVISEFPITIEGGDKMQITGNTLLSDAKKAFLEEVLKKAGWQEGKLSAEQVAAVDERLFAIAQLRTELYTKTGFAFKDIELNFIKRDTGPGSFDGRNYVDKKTAHFIGEAEIATPTSVIKIIEMEGETIANEVKKRVEEEINKALSEANQARIDRTVVNQLEAEIQARKEKLSSEQQQQVETAGIEAEIARLKRKIDWFVRKSQLAKEIPEAQVALDGAEARVKIHQATLKISGESSVDLLAWSDARNPESWQKIKEEYNDLIDEKKRYADEITSLTVEIQTLKEVSQALGTLEFNPDGTPKRAVPNPDVVARYNHLTGEIDIFRAKISKDKDSSGKTLQQVIDEKKKIYERRKKACDENSEVLGNYDNAKNTLWQKQTESDSIDDQISKSPTDEQSVDDIDKKIEEQKELLEKVGKPKGEDQLEIQAMTALKIILPSSERDNREQRMLVIRRGLMPKLEIVTGSEWEKYPPVILRCVQILWGDEIFLPYPPKELAEQVNAVLKSKKYLDIFINEINSTGANMTITPVEGAYEDITQVLPSTADIFSVSPDQVDKKIIDTIVEKMRKAALNIR